MTIDPFTLNNLLLTMAGVAGAFLAALWLSLMVWTYRDMRSRSRDPLLRILAVLLVVVLFLPGIFVYLILRPQRTLEDEYQKALEEEALLQSIEERPVCPGCGGRIKDNWMVCPSCYTRLKKTCRECGRLMELAWNLCPYCGRATPGMRHENLTMDDAMRDIPVDEAGDAEGMIPAEDFVVEEVEAPPEAFDDKE